MTNLKQILTLAALGLASCAPQTKEVSTSTYQRLSPLTYSLPNDIVIKNLEFNSRSRNHKGSLVMVYNNDKWAVHIEGNDGEGYLPAGIDRVNVWPIIEGNAYPQKKRKIDIKKLTIEQEIDLTDKLLTPPKPEPVEEEFEELPLLIELTEGATQ